MNTAPNSQTPVKSLPALVIIAHGSRLASSNDEIRILTEQIKKHTATDFSYVGTGFLECAKPSIPEAIKHAVKAISSAGATSPQSSPEILIFPYFLAKGSHVAKDIPKIVESEQLNNPAVKLTLLPYLGNDSALREVILAQLKKAF